MFKTMTSPREKQPAIDCNGKLEIPLDYSFLSLTCIEDCCGEEPRVSSPRKPLPKKTADDKWPSKCLRLNNNILPDLKDFEAQVAKIVEKPEDITWIDLSFNELTKIDEVLCKFPKLQLLYLHGNQIDNINEVNKLAKLPNLKKLTLHGNPIENQKGYRNHVLTKMGDQLRYLDFSCVTKADRATANTWSQSNAGNKRSRKKQMD